MQFGVQRRILGKHFFDIFTMPGEIGAEWLEKILGEYE